MDSPWFLTLVGLAIFALIGVVYAKLNKRDDELYNCIKEDRDKSEKLREADRNRHDALKDQLHRIDKSSGEIVMQLKHLNSFMDSEQRTRANTNSEILQQLRDLNRKRGERGNG